MSNDEKELLELRVQSDGVYAGMDLVKVLPDGEPTKVEVEGVEYDPGFFDRLRETIKHRAGLYHPDAKGYVRNCLGRQEVVDGIPAFGGATDIIVTSYPIQFYKILG